MLLQYLNKPCIQSLKASFINGLYSLPLLETIGIDMTDSTLMEQGFKILEEDILKLEKLLK